MRSTVRIAFAAALLLSVVLPVSASARSDRSHRTGGPAPRITVVTVKMVDDNFRPRTIDIAKGTKVKWVNRGDHTHSSTSSAWSSGLLRPGESFSRTFRRVGTFSYHCTVHLFMRGTVVVS